MPPAVFNCLPIGADCFLKVFTLFAAARAEFRQDSELFLRLVHIAGLDIELAEVLAGSLVVWLQFQRLGVIGERGFEIAGLTQGKTEQIVDISLLGIFGPSPSDQRERRRSRQP